jgi:hypothetical protein
MICVISRPLPPAIVPHGVRSAAVDPLTFREAPAQMDEAKLGTVVKISGTLMILVLAGAFIAVIRAGLQAAAH